jgi:hypothetical protein
MAVRTQENALVRLFPELRDSSGEPPVREPERFRGSVDVMELECGDAPVVPAQAASATRLSNEDRFDLSPALGYRL